jgi:internalin A
MVEQVRADHGFAGRIEIRTQRGDAGGLLAALAHLVKAHQDQLGVASGRLAVLEGEGGLRGLIDKLTGRGTEHDAELLRAAERTGELLKDERGDNLAGDKAAAAMRGSDGRALVPAAIAPRALARLSPAPEPLPERAYYVSYAWGRTDAAATPEERLREEVVAAIEALAREKGAKIIRDRDVMRFGDSITNFMDQIAQGRRIFVVLSAKYLRSAFCMYELFSIWHECRRRQDVFRERVSVIVLPDAAIYTRDDRLLIAKHWAKEFEDQKRSFSADPELLSPNDFIAFKLAGEFAHRVGDILALIADTLNPQSIADISQLQLD